jgi:hypothetical protein
VRTAAQELEGSDILVNDAVNLVIGAFLEPSDEAWLNQVNVKIMGHWAPFTPVPGAFRTPPAPPSVAPPAP